MTTRTATLCALIFCTLALGACAGPRHAPPTVSVELGSGLAYEITVEGEGEGALPIDTVTANVSWAGRTIGPIERMSNKQRTIPLRDPNLIEGLQLGLVGIRAGETRTLFIPWRLGYGDTGRPPIPPHENLICTITCLSIERGDPR